MWHGFIHVGYYDKDWNRYHSIDSLITELILILNIYFVRFWIFILFSPFVSKIINIALSYFFHFQRVQFLSLGIGVPGATGPFPSAQMVLEADRLLFRRCAHSKQENQVRLNRSTTARWDRAYVRLSWPIRLKNWRT